MITLKSNNIDYVLVSKCMQDNIISEREKLTLFGKVYIKILKNRKNLKNIIMIVSILHK